MCRGRNVEVTEWEIPVQRFLSIVLSLLLVSLGFLINPVFAVTGTDGCLDWAINNAEVTITSGGTCEGSLHIPGSISIDPDTFPVTAIGGSAFAGNQALIQVTIPDSVLVVGDSAFRENSNLQSLSLGAGLISIGSLLPVN